MGLKAILATLLVIGSTAFAGNEGGGGGKGSVCRDATGNVQVAYLLDLWESENVFIHPIHRTDEPVEVQYERALINLENAMDWKAGPANVFGKDLNSREYFHYQMMEQGKWLFGRPLPGETIVNTPNSLVKWLTDVVLPLTPDSYERAQPRKCPVEQIIRYEDDLQQISVNAEIVQKMPNTDYAALVLHENIYKYLRSHFRKYRENNSIRVRRAIGLAFSSYQFKSVESQLPPRGQYVRCDSPDGLTTVYLMPNHFGCLSAFATQINGQPMLGFQEPTIASCAMVRPWDHSDHTYLTAADVLKTAQEYSTWEYNKHHPIKPSLKQKVEAYFSRAKPKDDGTLSDEASRLIPGETNEIEAPAVGSFDKDGIATGRMEMFYTTSNKDNTRGPYNYTGLSARIRIMDLSDPDQPIVVPQLDCGD